MAAGRPKKYTKKALNEAVSRYFRSISRTITVEDDAGREILNDEGDAVRVLEYIVPPSVSALCIHLGIERSTWQNYCDEALHPEFKSITSMARARIEAYLEEQLLTREKGVQGIIFNLQNNYGWKQKVEAGLDEKTRTAAQESMGIREKLAIIAAAQALGTGDGEDG